MRPAAYLRDRLPDILERLENFARVQRHDVPALVAFLKTTLQASAGRAAGGATAARKRAAHTQRVVLNAAGALPMNRSPRELVSVIRARMTSKGLDPPDDKTIRRVLRCQENKREFATELPPLDFSSGYASTSHST